jgi:hypothetical protein
MVTMLSLVHGFLNGMQDFGTAVKRPGVSSMILKQKDKAWNGASQALQDTKNFYFKSQKTK